MKFKINDEVFVISDAISTSAEKTVGRVGKVVDVETMLFDYKVEIDGEVYPFDESELRAAVANDGEELFIPAKDGFSPAMTLEPAWICTVWGQAHQHVIPVETTSKTYDPYREGGDETSIVNWHVDVLRCACGDEVER